MRKIVKLIGPYPYNPYLLLLFCFSIFFFRFIRAVAYIPPGPERLRATGIIFVASIIPGAIYAGGSILLTRYRFWSSKSTLFYVIEVACFEYVILQYLHAALRYLYENLGYSDKFLVASSARYFLMGLLLILFTLALMHRAERKISDRLLMANNLVAKLEKERSELIHFEESLRQQVSQVLHDRVQSELMVIGIKLKSISGKSSLEINEVIEDVVHRLENTRAADVKELIQILTPNLEAGSLSSALDLLLEQYRGNMEVSVQISPASEELNSETLLGVFRIIEQAVLNSFVHGPAHRVQINVNTDARSVTELIVADDGPGADLENLTAGVGTAIIDSWIGILNGSREIDTAPGHGYRLHATLPG